MKQIYLLSMLSALTFNVYAIDIKLPQLGVYDGDTIYTELPLSEPLNKIKIRIIGLDTPEIRGKCDYEIRKAKEAKEYLTKILSHDKVIIVRNPRWDKYGGRILGDVFLESGVSVRSKMIEANMARPYDGGSRKEWCNIKEM